MFKYINILELDRVKLLKSIKGFLVSSDIVLETETEKLESRVLKALSKAYTSFSTLLSDSKTSVNI